MEITVEAVQLPVYWVKDNRKGFTYDHVKEIRDNVAKLKKSYYRNRSNNYDFEIGAQIPLVSNLSILIG